ncbi:hypothetical protein [Streptomyces phaeochromogenes]|uniref:hypothetical protein n=1 Tax=Streptomyces phaeochromogenes TaxID=1923 RepID=UPI0037205880
MPELVALLGFETAHGRRVDRQDPALAPLLAVGVGAVVLVAEQRIGAAAWTTGAPGHGRDAVDQGEGLGDVVDGPTGLPRTTPTEAVPQPYRYAGTYQDPTGLYKMGHRYYECGRSGGGMRRENASAGDAIRGVRTFSAILIVGGICACVAGTVTGDAVPIALGAIAVVCGLVLAVFAFLGHRKTRS